VAIKELSLKGEQVTKPKKKYLKFAFITGMVFVLLIISLALYIGLVLVPSVTQFRSSAEGAFNQVKKVESAVNKENVVLAKEETIKLRDKLKESKNKLDKLWLVRFVPIANGYYNDANHLMAAAIIASEAGEIAADGIIPFADVLGLKGVKSKTKAEEKTQVIVKKVIPSLIPLADKLEEKLNQIGEEISQVDPYRYPEGFRIKDFAVRKGLVEAKENIDKAKKLLPDVKLLLTTIPSVLGEPKEKTYLILFQNDKEIRATGGFITAYAVAKIKGGKLIDIKSDDIYKLDRRFTPKEPAPEPLQKYLLLRIYPIRDSNLSPDFLVSAQKFESFYNTIPGVQKVDGIIALDTEFVRGLIEVTGPIKVQKLNDTFSAENNEFGIPDVVYKLELYAERVFKGSERKGFIGDLMNTLIDKILNSPPEKFEPLFQTFLNEANEKHLLFYLHNKDAQALVEKFNFAGRIKDYDGDYLHVNNSNFAGLKANLFVKQKIEQDIVTTSDGTITKKVSVTLNNPSEKLAGWLNSNYRNWMRIYVPEKSKLVSKVIQQDFKEAQDLEKKVFESFSVTPILGSSTTTFTYEIPFKVKPGEEYKMLIQKQAGLDATKMIIRLNGKVVEEFDLLADKEIKLKL